MGAILVFLDGPSASHSFALYIRVKAAIETYLYLHTVLFNEAAERSRSPFRSRFGSGVAHVILT
jgi:hypothetical protein